MKQARYYPWVVVALLWFVALLNYLDRQMLSTMKPSIQLDIRELESATNFGRLMAVFLWIYGFMSPVSGIIADKVSRKWLIIGSLFVWSGVTLLMSYATGFNQLYWLRAVMGISEALYIPAALSLIADYHSSSTRSLAVGIHMTGLYMGQALGGFGATIAAAYSWQDTFHGFGFIGVVYAVVLIFFLKERRSSATTGPLTDEEHPHFFQGLKGLLTLLPFWIILLYFSIPSIPGWAIKNWLPTLFSNSLHVPMSQAGPVATITIAASSFIGVIAGGLLSDRWVQWNVKGRVYTSAIGLGLTIPALFLLGVGHSTFFLVASAFCFGIGFGMTAIICPSCASLLRRGTGLRPMAL
ncbi:Sugar phosphate permease [Chitinophaga rupis]|uniref:Sugar phosphate permease n=1 Tax=Chitinophaga rupis TaxID=573321 RepID=A0A1H7VWG9_9BACT|nr:MFS transporter [Chitinophaga rupis]SEM13157.1 Sugar phosphate permease [Chitinophaga rupis]